MIDNWWQETTELVEKKGFKPLFKKYLKNEIAYWDYKARVRQLVNEIRKAHDVPEYDIITFEDGWQFRSLAGDKYAKELEELLNLIFGWW